MRSWGHPCVLYTTRYRMGANDWRIIYGTFANHHHKGGGAPCVVASDNTRGTASANHPLRLGGGWVCGCLYGCLEELIVVGFLNGNKQGFDGVYPHVYIQLSPFFVTFDGFLKVSTATTCVKAQLSPFFGFLNWATNKHMVSKQYALRVTLESHVIKSPHRTHNNFKM